MQGGLPGSGQRLKLTDKRRDLLMATWMEIHLFSSFKFPSRALHLHCSYQLERQQWSIRNYFTLEKEHKDEESVTILLQYFAMYQGNCIMMNCKISSFL